jgi:peptide chain release factor 1
VSERSTFADRLEQILARRDELTALVATASGADYARLTRELAELEPVCARIEAWRSAQREAADLAALADDPTGDPEMRALARAEQAALAERLPALERSLRLALLPVDAADRKSAILEIRAGTGGEEAALFAADLVRMYTRYAQLQGWRVEVLSLSETGIGGVKEATLAIEGQGVFAKLKFEAGVHRVQRVPATEAQGRIHTSAATVAVLPEAEEVDVAVSDQDLRIDVFRASGAGGQHVNRTESAVRITHLPTGLVVTQQDEKSQHKNKAKALKILRARLFEMQREQAAASRAADRRGQIGSGDRSERIRTYNFPQNRVTDHRINLTLYDLDKVIDGSGLDRVIEPLIEQDEAARLAAAG